MSSANDISIDMLGSGVLNFSKCNHNAICLAFSPISMSSSPLLHKDVYHLLWLWGKLKMNWGRRGTASTEVSGLGKGRPTPRKVQDRNGLKAGGL